MKSFDYNNAMIIGVVLVITICAAYSHVKNQNPENNQTAVANPHKNTPPDQNTPNNRKIKKQNKIGLSNEQEPNNSIVEANFITAGKKITGVLTPQVDKKDYFDLEIQSPSKVVFYWHILDGNPKGSISLMSESRKILVQEKYWHDNNYYQINEYLAPFNYYILLESPGQSCKYELWYEVNPLVLEEAEPNNSQKEATNMISDNKFTGILTGRTDEKDYWVFNVGETSEVAIYWHIIDGNAKGSIGLLADNGKTIEEKSYWHEDNYYTIKQYLNPGKYFLSLKSRNSLLYEIWFESD